MNKDCPFCLVHIEETNVITFKCNHKVHFQCWSENALINKVDLHKCPLCRNEVYESDVKERMESIEQETRISQHRIDPLSLDLLGDDESLQEEYETVINTMRHVVGRLETLRRRGPIRQNTTIITNELNDLLNDMDESDIEDSVVEEPRVERTSMERFTFGERREIPPLDLSSLNRNNEEEPTVTDNPSTNSVYNHMNSLIGRFFTFED